MFSRPVSYVVAGAASAATLSAASAPAPLYPVYQRLWGFSAFTLTLIFAVYVFALLAALLTVGSLSDRVGRRPVAGAAMLLLAVGMVVFATADGTGGLMIARIVQGLAVGAATGTTTAMIMDSAPDPRSGSVVSSAVPPLGIGVGAVVAGALVQFAPLPRQLVYWVFGAAYLLLAVLVWFIPERARESAPAGSIWRSLVPSAALPADVRPTFFRLLPSIAATWALGGLYLSLGSSILGSVLDVRSHFVVGVVLGVFFVAGVAGTIVSSRLPEHIREWFGYGTLGSGVVVTVVALPFGAFSLYLIGSVLAGLGFGASFRFAVNALGEAAPSARRGEVFATMYIVSYLAFSLPALVAGLVAVHVGLEPTAVAYGIFEVALVLIATVTKVVRMRQLGTAARPDASAAPVSRTFTSPRHTTHYLECGPDDGPLLIFVHGWPSIGLIWRAQLEAFAAEGWHCIAPDLRGFGESSVPAATGAYAIEQAVADLAELHEQLGGRPAVWVGHDWGSIVVGALAAHEPQRSRAVALVSWAYFPAANSLDTLVPLVDRSVYPADRYPDGQWDYYRYYTTHFETAVADLDADPAASLASIYRRGDPAAVGRVAPSAEVTSKGGRFGSVHRAPATPPDRELWPAADFDVLVAAFASRGFSGPCAYYTNDDANIAYARTAPDAGRLRQPVLFVNGAYDTICSIDADRQGEPMRTSCDDLTVVDLPAGHWLPVEQKSELTSTIRDWLRSRAL